MSFSIDEKVVCIHTFKEKEDACLGVVHPKKGEMYTIRTIESQSDGVYLRFHEIHNPVLRYTNGTLEAAYWEGRFRKLDYQFAEELEANLKKQVKRESV